MHHLEVELTSFEHYVHFAQWICSCIQNSVRHGCVLDHGNPHTPDDHELVVAYFMSEKERISNGVSTH